jgi:UDP-glucose 4-epimerase
MSAPRRARSVLVTGAGGYLGRQLVAELIRTRREAGGPDTLVALDVKPLADPPPGVVCLPFDVRNPELVEVLRRHATDTVVHLAAVVNPGPPSARQREYSIDVLGTRNLIDACVAAGVGKLVVTSSGAAYGYHPDNPVPLREEDPVRGSEEFAYAEHKRHVEELLEDCRVAHPELAQLVFRPGAILGESTSNPITELFEKPVVWGVLGSESPFSFVWDRDVVACLVKGVRENVTGIYNLAGDGATPLRDVARRLGKRFLPLPAWLLRSALGLLQPLGLTRYGPEQVDFLRYRPVLSNDRLHEEFGYAPELASDEVFEFYLRARNRRLARSVGR